MTNTAELADFMEEVSYETMSDHVREELKKRILDSIGIAIGAMGEEPVEKLRATVVESSSGGGCSLWGLDGPASPSQAAMYNTGLVRYLDFMDSFLAPGETPHPSDNVASAVVCGEYADRSGEALIEAVGIAYEIQAALAWNAPVRDRGWDHVTHTIFSATAASCHMLGLDREEVRNALGIAGTAHNALRVTRTGTISEWKGFASANTARNAVYSSMLAGNGMEGPTDVFEGEKGWQHIVAGGFEVDLDPGCEAVTKTMTKKYVAETYAQSAVDALLGLVREEDIDPDEIESIDLTTFHGAYQIIGGGEGGDRYEVEDKEQADHSLPYMLAVAVLDDRLMNEQYDRDRINSDDVQELLRKVSVEENDELTERFEDGHMPAVIDVETVDGSYHVEQDEFEGHPKDPISWSALERKFHGIASDLPEDRREEIVATVKDLEDHEVADLVALL